MLIFFCLVSLLAAIVTGIAVQQWLFKSSEEVYDPEWELYQQRYD
jgi:hypothetical protein